ncbi:hypothetical protein ENBRE01_0607 [Enteropsectra breve]|nr:hypothetical protein ENBRE01_0607 [Enteropsectra breve]
MPNVSRSNVSLARPAEKKDVRKLRSIMFDSASSLTFTPMKILLMSIAYIFIVYLLHIIVKLAPATSPLHLMVAIGALFVTLGISSFIGRKQK